MDELLATLGPPFAIHLNRNRAAAEVYLQDPGELPSRLHEISCCLAAWRDLLPDPVRVQPGELACEDWAEAWKRHFPVWRVSPRIVIKPSWEDLAVADAAVPCVIEIDPGMSFGTGRHGTTAACLGLVDQLTQATPRGSVLDAGCGSGILTIAAAKLGRWPVSAVDVDPAAVACARENLARNGIAGADCRTADIRTCQPAEPFGLVLANLEALPLIEAAAALAAALATSADARLVISGILDGEQDPVVAAFAREGLRVADEVRLDGWLTYCLRRA